MTSIYVRLTVFLAGTASVMSWTTPMPSTLDPVEMEVKNSYDYAQSSRSPINKRGLYGLGYHRYSKSVDGGYGQSALQDFKNGGDEVNQDGPSFGQALGEQGSGSEVRALGLSEISGPIGESYGHFPQSEHHEYPKGHHHHARSPQAYTFFDMDPLVHGGPSSHGHQEVVHGPDTDEFFKNIRLSYEGLPSGPEVHHGLYHEEDFKEPAIRSIFGHHNEFEQGLGF